MKIDVVAESRQRIADADAMKKLVSMIDDADARILLIEQEKKGYVDELAKYIGTVKEVEIKIPAAIKNSKKRKNSETPSDQGTQGCTVENNAKNEEQYGLSIEKVNEAYINNRRGILEAAKILGVTASELDMYCRSNKLVKKYEKNFCPKDESMHDDTSALGTYRTCKHCGKRIFITNPDEWVFKVRRKKGKIDYYCSYSHKRSDESED